uniref:Uncharacterized protein n=1 Tax=Magallana gigas TaxID=29159 RepID=A0A8W8MIM3_MAGGI
MAATSTVRFETELSPDGETPQFTLKESDQYRKGHYALQMTFFRGKVYIHVQDNHKGKQVSLPLDVFDALWVIREDIKAGTDLLRNLASPPSPPLITIAPPKKRRVQLKKRAIPLDDSDDELII